MKEVEPMASRVPKNEREWKKEIEALKEVFVVQVALREKEKDLWKTTEEEKWRIKESLRKIQTNNDQLKEEKENLLQEKGKLRTMAETEIEWRKEEIRQQKDQDDRLQLQVSQRLKQKWENFDKLY